MKCKRGGAGGYKGRKRCDLFASILYWCLRRRQWTSVEVEKEAVRTQGKWLMGTPMWLIQV